MTSVRPRTRRDGTTSWAVLYPLDGRQSSLTFADEKAARAFAAVADAHGPARALEMHGIDPNPRRTTELGAITLADWCRTHIDNLTGVEQYTLDGYERILRNDIAPVIGMIPLTELREADIAAWVKRMEVEPSPKTKRPVAPKTIANRHGFLSSALRAAVAQGLIPANVAAGRKLPRKTGDDDDDADEMRTLTRPEFDRLLAAGTAPYWVPLIEFMVSSGMRWGEVAALKPSDVDRDAGTVKVRRAWKHSSLGYTLGPPKTKNSRRTINLPASILDACDYSGQWLFTGQGGGPLRYYCFKSNVWDRAAKRSGLDPRPTPHDLRHTCASWMLAAGVPILTVSRHLGHESIKITADVYGDVDRTAHAAAADVMSRLLA